MSNWMWNVNALGLGTVVMLALAGGVALASHLAVFEARACTGLSLLQEGSYKYKQRLAQCMRDGRTLPAK